MKKRFMLWGIIALVVGVLGFAFAFVLLGQPSDATLFASNGQRIHYAGTDATGPIPRAVAGIGMMGLGGWAPWPASTVVARMTAVGAWA